MATISTPDLGVVLQAAGGFPIDVPQRLLSYAPDGTASVAFPSGDAYLDGQRLATYWGFTQRDETELDAFVRQQQVVTGLLPLLADEALRAEVADRLAQRAATSAEVPWLESFLARLNEAAAAGGLSAQLLPVEPFGATDPVRGASWQLRAAEAEALVADSLAASAPDLATGVVTLQVLNGVGRPGVAQEVDRALAGGGFRILRSENARSFAEPTTRILLYDNDPSHHQAAERVRALLGVGEILLSRQPQSVVDLTIVVGADFVPHHETRRAVSGARARAFVDHGRGRRRARGVLPRRVPAAGRGAGPVLRGCPGRAGARPGGAGARLQPLGRGRWHGRPGRLGAPRRDQPRELAVPPDGGRAPGARADARDGGCGRGRRGRRARGARGRGGAPARASVPRWCCATTPTCPAKPSRVTSA